MLTDFDQELLLHPKTPEEVIREAKPPLPEDTADTEIYAAHYRFKRSWQLSTAALGLLSVVLAGGLVSAWKRPPERIVVRVMPNGEFVQSKLADFAYDPHPNDAREYLERWATFRYRRLRESISRDFPKNYWFLERQLGQAVMQHDQQANLVANVLSGKMPENDVENVHADILGFEVRTVGDQKYGQGEALLDLTLVYPALFHEPHPRRVHLRVGVSFSINPAQVDEKARLWPEYGKVNGAGLTILRMPQENSVPIPETTGAPAK